MQTYRKLELFDQAVALIETGGDDSAVRLALLDECAARITAAKERITEAQQRQIAAARQSPQQE
jgi:hypothetical protein